MLPRHFLCIEIKNLFRSKITGSNKYTEERTQLQIPQCRPEVRALPARVPASVTAHFVTLSKNSRPDKWTLSLRHETRPAVSILVNF